MDMSDDDPLSGLALQPVRLADKATFDTFFQSLSEPLSDYTFSQVFSWSNSLRIFWKEIRGHLCIFANGTGDLTLLLPPIGDGGTTAALKEAYEVMDAYNAAHNAVGRSRVEYASEELLARIDRSALAISPMGPDYLYDVRRMIDLAGGDLASKRQLKNRFLRNYRCRVEAYDPQLHLQGCLDLLRLWKQRQDSNHNIDQSTSAIKRQKETLACELALRHTGELGLKGMVVYVGEERRSDEDSSPITHHSSLSSDSELSLRGFTLGENVGADQSSIIIEKTDLGVRGLAQFIFSEFCKSAWADRPLVNAGDDWGLETLAWTKMSYRPAKLLQKYELRLARPVQVHIPAPATPAPVTEETVACVRQATKKDLSSALSLEQSCFSVYCLSKRQLSYLQGRPSAVFLVAEQGGQVIAQGISLVRKHKRGLTGRIYSLAVNGEHRRKKVGQRLLKAMIAGLLDRGVKRIYLEVEHDNAPAIRLYEEHGFKRIDTIENYYGPGRNAVHMAWEK